MSLLDLLQSVGRAKPGTRALLAEQINAVDAANGGLLTLPIGTEIEITTANKGSLSAVAEIDGSLRRIYLFVEQYPALALRPNAAGAPDEGITAEMIKVGRDTLLASFPEEVLSERTPGLNRAVFDIYRAMRVL